MFFLINMQAQTLRLSLFLRRLLAMLYDSLLVTAILIIATAILLIFTKGHPISPENIFYQTFLLMLIGSFFMSFWLKGGQTAGMAAWKIRVVTLDDKPISFRAALNRFLIGFLSFLCFGLGFFWMLWDKEGLTLYDRFSKTKIILKANLY